MPDILCLGEPLLEFNRQSDGNYLPGHGGDTSNVAIAAARQGAEAGYITRLGNDAFGRSFLELWAREKVDSSAVVLDGDAPTAIYFVTHGTDGHEFSYFRSGSAASRMTPADLPAGLLKAARFLHVSGISQAISECAADTVFEAIGIVRDAGGRVSYDTNLRLKLWPIARARAVIHEAMKQCHIALPSMGDALHLTGLEDPDAIADFYLNLGAEIVVLKLGSEGSLVAIPDERRRVASPEVAAVDATAAGDTFDGAFLARLAEGDAPFAAARYASATAAISTLGYGAVAPIPYGEVVEEFLRTGEQKNRK